MMDKRTLFSNWPEYCSMTMALLFTIIVEITFAMIYGFDGNFTCLTTFPCVGSQNRRTGMCL